MAWLGHFLESHFHALGFFDGDIGRERERGKKVVRHEEIGTFAFPEVPSFLRTT